MKNRIRVMAIFAFVAMAVPLVVSHRLAARSTRELTTLGAYAGMEKFLIPTIISVDFLSGDTLIAKHAIAINRCVDVKSLGLKNCIVQDEFLIALDYLPKLQKLDLSNAVISDKQLIRLLELQSSVVFLNIDGCQLSDVAKLEVTLLVTSRN